MANKKLNDKQELFCREYIKDLNATKAAIRANYSESSARQIASDNLSKHDIQLRIQQLMEERNKRLEISSDGVLQRLIDWVESDITDVLCLSPAQIKELPIEFKRLITKIKHTTSTHEDFTNETIEVTLVSKEKAMDWINRHIGFYNDNKDMTGLEVVEFEFTEIGSNES